MNEPNVCPLSDGFSWWEKVYAQVSFFTMGIVGTVGIMIVDWPWVLPYIVVYWYGIPGIIMRHLNCPRCPHLHTYGDCLQFHPVLTNWIAKGRKTHPFTSGEKVLFLLIFLLVPTYPVYWLRVQPLLLGVFLLSGAMWYLGQWLYSCKRCRLESCPFNRAEVPS